MKEIESISSALFDKIRSRFKNVTLGNENAKAETDPEKARFFNFTYNSDDGAEFGTVTLSLIDEQSLKVYYGQNISGEMDREQRNEWYEFLRSLRKFAKRNLLTFDTRDINKSNLDLKDIKQQSKVDDTYTVNDVTVTESRLYGSPGRPYNSFGEKGKTKLLIRHQDKVNDEIRGARARKIESIFLETDIGERFKLEHTNLHGAWALAEHLNQGGTLHDEIADHINSMVSEMNAMKHFVRSTKHRQFEDQETADMTQSAIRHYDELKNRLRRMRNSKYYEEYFGNFHPEAPVEEEVDVDALRERFVKKIYDDRFNDALPYVYRAHKRQQNEAAGQLGNEFDQWLSTVAEGTWATPDSDDKIRALEELLKTPVPTGIDGVDAVTSLKPLIGDDELYDSIYHLADSQGPDADTRPLIKTWLQANMPEVLGQVDIGPNNADDATTSQATPVSPKVANDQYGATKMDQPVTESDDLDFIRSLAGIQRK